MSNFIPTFDGRSMKYDEAIGNVISARWMMNKPMSWKNIAIRLNCTKVDLFKLTRSPEYREAVKERILLSGHENIRNYFSGRRGLPIEHLAKVFKLDVEEVGKIYDELEAEGAF